MAAARLTNIVGLFKNTRSRVILLVTLVISVIAIVVGWWQLRTRRPGAAPQAAVTGVPGIQSIPGGDTASVQYIKTQETANRIQAEQALRKGTSAVPTILRAATFDQSTFAQTPGAPTGTGGQAGFAAACKNLQTKYPYCFAGVTTGQLTPNDMSAIAQACRAGVSRSVCQQELQRMVADGKLSPSEAEKLLAAYGKTGPETPGEKALAELTKADKLSPTTAALISRACAPGVPASVCDAELEKLKDEGKLTPAEMRKLLQAYGKEAKRQTPGDQAVAQLVKAGVVPPNVAGEIVDACKPGTPAERCEKELGKLAAAGQLTPEQARKLLTDYGKVVPPDLAAAGKVGQLVRSDLLPKSAAEQLLAACEQDANPQECAKKLKELIDSGALTPEQARKLLAAFGKPGAALLTLPAKQQAAPATTAVSTIPSLAEPSEAAADAKLKRLIAQQQQVEASQALQQALEQLKNDMNTQATALFAAWLPPPTQAFVEGEAPPQRTTTTAQQTAAGGTTAAQQTQSGTSSQQQQAADVKAGDIMFAILTTAVNSDNPSTPVMARIVQGKFKGAKLLGRLTREQDRVILSFNLMNLPSLPRSIAINAVAIDPQTAQAALASDVDHHYLQRYGGLFAATFLEGYGQAITDSGATTTVSINGITRTNQEFSPREELTIALGNTGSAFGDVFRQSFNRPPTVTVDSGIGIGILFLSDVTVQANT